jgi:hypothetical protein
MVLTTSSAACSSAPVRGSTGVTRLSFGDVVAGVAVAGVMKAGVMKAGVMVDGVAADMLAQAQATHAVGLLAATPEMAEFVAEPVFTAAADSTVEGTVADTGKRRDA